MSTLPENELDLEKLFLPAWAQQPSTAKLYAQYEGGEEPRDRRGGPRDRRPGRRPGAPPGSRPSGSRPPGGEQRSRGPQGDRRGPPRGDSGGKRSFGDNRRPFERRELREPPPLPEINVNLVPDDKGVESLARQIRTTGRAYPLFDIARLILERPERYSVTFSVKKNPEGKPIQSLFACLLDDTLWLSEDDAIAHVLRSHFTTFYQAERTATEPPKGKYTFVAQCGMSGVILGPPNYHDYQNQLRKLHTERFSRVPFEAFKARVRIVRDEAVVKQWIDDQSWKTEFVCLNLPEPLRLATRVEVEKHFRETHKENIVKPVEAHTLLGTAARSLRSPDLQRLMRFTWETQRRFPLQIATVLSQQFAGQGLQFFKVNKTITHVTIARPQFLNLETTPVSEGVKRIVEFINAHPKCSRRNLFEALAPSPAVVAVPSADAAAGSPAPAEAAGPTPEQTTVISDLHWLVHQGHVIEFANGMLDTAKKPLPKPPKPEKKTAEQPAETVSTTEPIAPAEIAAATPEAEQTTLATAAPVEVPESTEPPPENSTAEATSVQSETSTVAAPEVAAEKPSE
jgi:hypothetical protein